MVAISYTNPLIGRFKLLTDALAELDAVKEDVQAFIDKLLGEGEGDLAELRELALAQMEGAETPADLLAGMMQEITQPDIPPTVEEVKDCREAAALLDEPSRVARSARSCATIARPRALRTSPTSFLRSPAQGLRSGPGSGA